MEQNLDLPYCFDLPPKPRTDLGIVLVTGATGYIGGRLIRELLLRNYSVRVFVRAPVPDHDQLWPGVEVFIGDAKDFGSLDRAMKGVGVAFYLIHSLLLGRDSFESVEIKSAYNFRRAAEMNGLKRIIYLGGLGDVQKRKRLSKHLTSRLKVSEELAKGSVMVTTLRAAVVIGSGSASFEILKHLVKNSPVLLLPKWAYTNCQPISIRDIIKYLIGVMEINETKGKTYDIGGSTTLSYVDMLKIFSSILNKKNIYIKTFLSNYVFYGYIASLLTPVPAQIIMALFEGAKNEVVCIDNDIKKVLKFTPISYQEAIINALDREDQDKISTRWSDAYPPKHELAMKLHEIQTPEYISSYTLNTNKAADKLFKSICKVGGEDGWFNNNWMWRARGMIDSVLMGVGTSRGRKSQSCLKVNDVIGFWRVEDLEDNRRLLLRAEMKLPGKAWLEFKIKTKKDENTLSVTAYFKHKGLWGRLYWYIFVPFHAVLFKNLLKAIAKRS